MAVNTAAYFLFPPDQYQGGTGFSYKGRGLVPETPVAILYGQGTPDGDRVPFTSVNKGSLYMQMDATDDQACIWQKVDEGGDNADWVRMFVDGHALISNADIAASAGIVASKLSNNARRQHLLSKEFDIDNGAGTTDDDLIVNTTDSLTVLAAQVVYTEASDSGDASGANVRIGTTQGAQDIVTATNLENAKAIGSVTALTINSGGDLVAANGNIWVRHTGIAATQVGKYKVNVEYLVDAA